MERVGGPPFPNLSCALRGLPLCRQCLHTDVLCVCLQPMLTGSSMRNISTACTCVLRQTLCKCERPGSRRSILLLLIICWCLAVTATDGLRHVSARPFVYVCSTLLRPLLCCRGWFQERGGVDMVWQAYANATVLAGFSKSVPMVCRPTLSRQKAYWLCHFDLLCGLDGNSPLQA